MDYQDVEKGRAFFILHKDRKKQVITVWQRREDGYGLVIYFHIEEFWCNPPTDSRIESNAVKAIERYGIAYLPDGDAYIKEDKATPVIERTKWRQEYAKKFFTDIGNPVGWKLK